MYFKAGLATAALISTTCFSGNVVALEVGLEGLVNKSLMVYDDGRDVETNVVDNHLYKSQFLVTGEQALENGLTASVLMSFYSTNNGSNTLTQNTAANQSSTPVGDTSFQEAYSRVGLAGEWGAVFIGRQDTATDDAIFHDLGGVDNMLSAGFATHGAGLVFRDTNGALVTLGGGDASIGALAFGLDGAIELEDSVRYNTPVWSGFNGSISTSQGGDVDMTVRYANDYETWSVDSAVGYAFENSGTTEPDSAEGTVYASASVKHNPSGLAATIGYFDQSLENETAGNSNPVGYYTKVSYAWDSYSIGAEYAKVENAVAATTTDHELTMYGFGGQYDLGHGVAVSTSYKTYEADIAGTPTQDINVWALGMRVKF